jgi:hypothetical protein
MSTLKVTNIQATGETVSRPVAGVAAAYVSFNGVTVTIFTNSSLNVSSLTDDATGIQSANLTNSFSNEPAATMTSGKTAAYADTSNTSNISLASYNLGTSTLSDATINTMVAHGDLA